MPPSALTIAAEDPRSIDAVRLVTETCVELGRRYGTNASVFHPEDAMPPHGGFILARMNGEAAGCAAFRRMDEHAAEVKRMFVTSAHRRKGIARRLLAEIEAFIAQQGYTTARLETGTLQEEAIALYESAGYRRIPPFGPYVGNPISVCFEKALLPAA